MIESILSETICLFCFGVLFSTFYPNIKFTAKNCSDLCYFYSKVVVFFFFFFFFFLSFFSFIFIFYLFIFFVLLLLFFVCVNLCIREIFFLLNWNN